MHAVGGCLDSAEKSTNKDVYKDDNGGSTSHIIHVPIGL